MNAPLNICRGSFLGEYRLEVRKAATGALVRQVGPFKNKITDIGLDAYATRGVFAMLFVGTGTSASSVLDTQMGAFKARDSGGGGVTRTRETSSPYWSQMETSSRFNAGTATGNLTEVGIGWDSGDGAIASAHRVWSRELIVDGAGNPTSLTILSDEYLDVFYTVRWYPMLDDVTGSVTLDGVSYGYTARSALVTSAGFAGGYSSQNIGRLSSCLAYARKPTLSLGAVTGNLTGGEIAGGEGTISNSAYVPSSLEKAAVVTWGLSAGNHANGIRGIRLTYTSQYSHLNQYYQILFDKDIPKTASKILSLGFKFNWGRY